MLLLSTAIAQGIEGKVLDERGNPVPYANIFVEEAKTGTSADEQGMYLLKLPFKGDYRVIVSALGYTSNVDTIIVGDRIAQRNFLLISSAEALEEIVITASKRDPAYAIMREASKRRKANLSSIGSYRSEVYLKAREDINKTNKKRKKKPVKKEEPEKNQLEVDPFAEQNRLNDSLMNSINLVERQFTLNFQAPDNYKEERKASKTYGTSDGLFVPLFGDGDFNFYRSQVDFGSLAENRLISPLSLTAVLSYKFKLLSEKQEEDGLVYEVRLTPRKVGNATLEGTIWINAEGYTINRLEVELPRGALKIFDAFRYEQSYASFGESLWLPSRQVFNYETKLGKRQSFKGRTTLRYSDYELDYTFKPKFFGGEVAITSAEAYERDTTYWAAARIEPLEIDEKQVVHLRDSIFARVNSIEYKDSIETAYNKVQILDIIWDGVGFRNHRKQEHLYFGPLPSWVEFNPVGGWRFGPYVSYYRRFENGQRLYTSVNANVGLSTNDWQGNTSTNFRYDPHHIADVWGGVSKGYEAINDFDAFVNQLRRSNYILVNRVNAGHRRELTNGLYLTTTASFQERLPAPAVGTETFLEDIFTDEPPIPFEPYKTFSTEVGIEFTPFQKYLTEPLQKVVIGSAWPTIGLRHKRGWNGPIGSEVDFDYLELSLKQRLQLGAFGNMNYRLEFGSFVNSKDLRFVDVRRFRESDFWFSDPLRSFQLLDTNLTAIKPFIDFHVLHHFNGAILNNIPLLRKTRVEVVAGGGFMYLTDGDFRHEEVMAGIERVFKLGARRRLRLGVYGVVANSSIFPRSEGWKIGFDIIDTWKKDWSF